MRFRPLRSLFPSGSYLVGLLLMQSIYFPTLSQGQVKIMPLGDSITHGSPQYNSYRRSLWLQLQEAKYDVDFVGGLNRNEGGPPPNPDFDLEHHGHWGWTTAMLLPEVWHWTRDHRPDVVLLHAGTNDCFGEKSVEQIRDNLGGIIEELRRINPQVKVLLAQLIPTAPPYAYVNPKITALNELLPALALAKTRAQSPVVLVDQHTGFSQAAGEDLYDGVHPNARGEAKMATRWYEALQAAVLLGKPLPVGLVAFTARPVPAGVALTWATTSEQDNAGFHVERSRTGVAFEPVGQVGGHGTTRTRHTYSFLDSTPPQAVLYYRLRQTDTQGTITFSGIRTVSAPAPGPLLVSPNPAREVVTVQGVEKNTLVTIWNMRGQRVQAQPAASTPLVISVVHLASGLYQVKAGGQSVRLIKQ